MRHSIFILRCVQRPWMRLASRRGIPSSGKTFIAQKLHEYFSNEKTRKVITVSENTSLNTEKNAVYSDSQNEKVVRGILKSETVRQISTNDLVILDGLNYIKGFRYELYCISKQHKTPHCVIQCITPIERAWKWNEKRARGEQYSRDVFDGLVQRYESPDSRNRWDSPFFALLPEDPIPYHQIYDVLYERKPPPPNQSTQLQPLSSNNFLHELDKCTQEIVSAIMNAQKLIPEGEIKLPGHAETIYLPRKITLAELTRIRRQFITYSKSHPVEDFGQIKILFIQYINKTIS